MEEHAKAAAGGRRGGVRVVARICPPDAAAAAAAATGGLFQVAVEHRHHPDSSALVSFIAHGDHRSTTAPGRAPTPRKDKEACEYKLDWCYLKDDPNHHIFCNEVKPLIHHLRTTTACVITCGATAKNHLFMGSQDQPGLVTMAMEQILQFSKDIGGAVKVSSYQVLQDNHIFDLLEPKDHEVLILEDADGRTNLKGLSKVDVKSIHEFARLRCFTSNQQNQPTKASSQLEARGHQGLIVYVSKFDQQGRECAAAKMNFLNLAGYVDPKKKHNNGGLALPNSNKSMYALMNVVQALNSNQSFVPYRQSKVTRILQDSLCKTSGAVLIACLNELSCQDAISTLCLASRSSQVVNEQCNNLSMSARSASKSSVNLSMNAKNSSRSKPVMHSAKNPGSSLSTSVRTKQNNTMYTMSGRKLFCPSTHSSKEDAVVVASTIVEQAEEVQSSLCMEIQAPTANKMQGHDEIGDTVDILASEMQEMLPCTLREEDYSSPNTDVEHSCTDLTVTCATTIPDNLVKETPANTVQTSSKLSDRLREISNSLKLLSTRPVSMTTQKSDTELVQKVGANTPEPKTPVVHLKYEQDEDPSDIFMGRSAGIKNSLVQECLTFLNSANKEQLKSLKGIGEKRANYILELRNKSPELFKEVGDLRDIIGMNSKEIKKMMSGIIDS